ncbi:MAG: D-2-hydroxyacid dehydrogenase [Acidobacteriia bacterium]|nr:D-2-hydroxyacid dehydrogenase [Terriglobia bacterium]
MTNNGYSRRRFLRNMAAGSGGAALAALPMTASEAKAEASPEPPTPVTVESYPLVEPTAGTTLAQVRIVTQEELPRPYVEKLRGTSPNVEVNLCRSREEFRREVTNAHIIYGDFSQEDLQAAKQLKWIQYTAAGVEHILWSELVESPIVLTNMQRMYSPTISETAIGFMLTLARGLNGYALQTRERRWKPLPGLSEISGLKLGMVGLGGIGTDTAYRAHYGFNMRILAVDPKPIPKPSFVAELHSLDWLPQMVPQVDILMSAAPHTPLSQGMFNESIFHAMKPSAFFINMSRGKLVDTPALVRALKEGRIAGAGLDVTDPEPLPADHPLWTAGNVIITSHTSARSPGSEQRKKDLFAENLRRYVAGLPLLNVVDKKRGY